MAILGRDCDTESMAGLLEALTDFLTVKTQYKNQSWKNIRSSSASIMPISITGTVNLQMYCIERFNV